MTLREYLIRRLLLIIPTFLGITLITFLVIQLAPGNPAAMKLRMGGQQGFIGDKVTTEIVEQTRALYGLDKPIWQRYVIWLRRVVTLDFGNSYKDHRPVMDKIWERLPITVELNLISIFLVYLIAVPVGVYSAVHQGSIVDRITTIVLFVLYSLPNFWVAVLLIMFLGGGDFLDVFPVYGIVSSGMAGASVMARVLDHLWHIILPIFCLTYGGLAALSRYQRAGMLEVIRQDYIRTARAKGLPEKLVIFKHAFRNSIIPIVTLLGYLLPGMFGGSVIIENIFSIPGMGQLGFESVLARDYPVVLAIATISAVLTLLGILVSDLLYVWADPRITYEAEI
ncbi:inner membrane ABC transporter permease protein YejB [bacterium BMS3Abin14]|nr:inner membrane ABC transporter permease protein YejB [bacterium BMS3Abin14]